MKRISSTLVPHLFLVVLITLSFHAAGSDFREALGQDCGGDDPRSRAICECIFDQMEANLSDEELEAIADHHRRSMAGEEFSDNPEDYDMAALMALASKMQEIDMMQCAGALPQ